MLEVRNLTVQYAPRTEPTLRAASLHVAPGETVLVAGPTGCGKSTLMNALNGVLFHASDARLTGDVLLDGRSLREIPLHELCRSVGSVFQNPESQICTPTVEMEVAFGLENLALPRREMRGRIKDALEAVELMHRREENASDLSGGQKQRLAVACALAMRPRILLLDEPVSQLDPQGAERILGILERLKREHGIAVVLIEHRLTETMPAADRFVLMDAGRILSDRPRKAALRDLQALRDLGMAPPHLPDLFERLGREERPLDPETAPLLELPAPKTRTLAQKTPKSGGGGDEPICVVEKMTFAYGKKAPRIFENFDLELRLGERVALLGANGSGKSTLLHLIAGARRPLSGAVRWRSPQGRPGLVLQQPDLMLIQETVDAEVGFAPEQAGLSPAERDRRVAENLERLDLEGLRAEAPFSLSRGQRLRTAVASVLSMNPGVLLLDEPTAGQDRDQIDRMMRALAERFALVVFCTHDLDAAARFANRVLVLHEGRVAVDASPHAALADDATLEKASLLPTAVQRYARRLGLDALTVDETFAALHGTP